METCVSGFHHPLVRLKYGENVAMAAFSVSDTLPPAPDSSAGLTRGNAQHGKRHCDPPKGRARAERSAPSARERGAAQRAAAAAKR
eukprot:7059568-Prymnesium_polylepis.2